MVKDKPAYPIKVLNKSLSILETLLQHSSSMSIMEISKKLKIYPSTIHRVLNTLKYRGYVEQNPADQKYRLGLKLVELGMAAYFGNIRTLFPVTSGQYSGIIRTV